jgi:hypothetical protein
VVGCVEVEQSVMGLEGGTEGGEIGGWNEGGWGGG